MAGFVGKDSELDRIATALDAIAARRPPPRPRPPAPPKPSPPPRPLTTAALTPREAEVLKRIAAGQGTKAMAARIE